MMGDKRWLIHIVGQMRSGGARYRVGKAGAVIWQDGDEPKLKGN